jgi:hypothetical protein
MRVIIPKKIDLIESSITEDYSDWSASATYASGEKAYCLYSDYDELLSYGDCTFDRFSAETAGWSYDGPNSQYDCDGSQTTTSSLYQTVSFTSGLKYLVQFEVKNYSAGSIQGYVGGGTGTDVSADGTYQQVVTASNSDSAAGVKVSSDFVGSVTNVSCKRMSTLSSKRIYESQVGSNVGNFPATDSGSNWVKFSASNQWKMFDDFTTSQTETTETLQVKVDSSKCDAIALFNTEGVSVDVIVTNNNISTTSTSSITVGTGSKTLTVASTARLLTGNTIIAEDQSDFENYILGTITDITGSDVTVTVTDTGGSGTISTWNVTYVYSATEHSLYQPECVSWSDYFFADIRFNSSLTDTFTADFNTSCRVKITGSAGQMVKCGHMLVGRTRELGDSQWGLQAGISDYSKKEENSFGETYLEQGNWAKKLNYDIQIDNDSFDTVYQILSQIRAIPCAYDANNESTSYSALIAYGTYEDFDVTLPGPVKSICTLEIQGLI